MGFSSEVGRFFLYYFNIKRENIKNVITSVNGDTEKRTINSFVDNMLSRDSLHLRQEMKKNAPDIELQQTIEIEGEEVRVDIPMTTNFFWPTAV